MTLSPSTSHGDQPIASVKPRGLGRLYAARRLVASSAGRNAFARVTASSTPQ